MSVMTVREAINSALAEEMRRDPSVVLMGCDVALKVVHLELRWVY